MNSISNATQKNVEMSHTESLVTDFNEVFIILTSYEAWFSSCNNSLSGMKINFDCLLEASRAYHFQFHIIIINLFGLIIF